MKILHVIHSIDPRSGGPSHAIRSMVREQGRAGHDVAVLTTTVQSAEPWEAREGYMARMYADPDFSSTELYLARAYGRRRPWNRYAFSRDATRWLREHLGRGAPRPDVAHIHGTFSHLTATAAAAARRYGVPYILRPAGSLDGLCLQRGSRRLKRLFTSVYLQRDLRGAAYLHATSSSEARELRASQDADRIRVIPHGVHPGRVAKHSGARFLQSEFPQLRGRTVVLFMGRLHAIKRVEVLVQAVARLRSSRPSLALLIAGHDAGHMPSLVDTVRSAGIEDRVVFAGFLQGEQKQAALAGADVFALPSAHENFGVAVVEAMAHGTPVLVAPEVASHSYVDESGAGVTAAGVADEFARGLAEILDADRDGMGRRGRQFVEENLSWPAIVRQLDQMYEDACRSTAWSHTGSGSC